MNEISNLEGAYYNLNNALLVLETLSDDYFGTNSTTIGEAEKIYKLVWEYERNQALLNLVINDTRNQIKVFEDNLYALYEKIKNKGE